MSEPSDKGLAKPGWLNKSDKAAAWVAVVGLCLVVWSQLRAAIPQAWWEKLPRPLLLLLACSALLLGCTYPAPAPKASCYTTPPRLVWMTSDDGWVHLPPDSQAELINWLDDVRECIKQ